MFRRRDQGLDPMRRPTALIAWALTLLSLAPAAIRAASDTEFDRLEGKTLAALPGRMGIVREGPKLGFADIASLPRVLPGIRAGLILVRTDDGNLAPIQVLVALRRPKPGGGPPLPMVVLDRYATYEMPGARRRLAAGAGVSLFPDFLFDLDTGQVVPPGQGADLAVHVSGTEADSLTLEPLPGATLWSVVTSPLDTDEPGPHRPTPGKAVVPADFAGRYRLEANGQWSGRVDLAVGDRNVVTGTFRSDQTGESYRITGEAAFQSPHRILFAVDLPRTRLDFDGRLWTDGKAAVSGFVSLQGRDYGFSMTRENDARGEGGVIPAFVPADPREQSR
jgi:hypothetical protein